MKMPHSLSSKPPPLHTLYVCVGTASSPCYPCIQGMSESIQGGARHLQGTCHLTQPPPLHTLYVCVDTASSPCYPCIRGVSESIQGAQDTCRVHAI
jgi:hypothetical protein